MPEIYQFGINKADATQKDGSLTVRLFYPKEPEITYKRQEGNLEFGIKVFRNLLEKGYSEIANQENKIVPPSVGMVYLLEDGVLVLHRRDKMAPVHKLYHSVPAGFPQTREATYTLEGLTKTGLKENSEECLLVTKEKNPRLIVQKDSKNFVLETANNLGLDLKSIYVKGEDLKFNDKLEVYDHEDKLLFSARGLIDWSYESHTVINLLQVRKLPLKSNQIYPIDCEIK